MTFSDMANKLLKEYGFDVNECASEIEAINESQRNIKEKYPVYYSDSDTTGEKAYEEFYTDLEEVDLERHNSLGVVINLKPREMSEINILLKKLKQAFDNLDTTKADIVKIMKGFLVNFDHKEVGKSLDSKM